MVTEVGAHETPSCKSDPDCLKIGFDCIDAYIHCVGGKCEWVHDFHKKISCANDFDCNKKFDPKFNVHRYVNGQCVFGWSA